MGTDLKHPSTKDSSSKGKFVVTQDSLPSVMVKSAIPEVQTISLPPSIPKPKSKNNKNSKMKRILKFVTSPKSSFWLGRKNSESEHPKKKLKIMVTTQDDSLP